MPHAVGDVRVCLSVYIYMCMQSIGHADLPSLTTDGAYNARVPYHGSKFLILMPATAEWPLPFELAPWMKQPVPPTEA